MRIELVDCERVLLEEVADKGITRDSLALTYAMAICSSEDVVFKEVNKAIMKRWSPSGLQYIKKQAWKLIEKRGKGVGENEAR